MPLELAINSRLSGHSGRRRCSHPKRTWACALQMSAKAEQNKPRHVALARFEIANSSGADDGYIELMRYSAEQYLAHKIVSQNYKMSSATLTVSGINHPAKPFVP